MTHTVLVVGSGGREHALAHKLALSPQVSRVMVAPGNGGTTWDAAPGLASCENAPVSVGNFDGLVALAQENDVSLTVVGPEVPLTEGIVDRFEAEGLRIFGPVQAAAQLEGSKAFARDFMHEVNIPSPAYGVFTDVDAANAFIDDFGKPLVVKASGLAAGKGVLICDTAEQAKDAVKTVLVDAVFGDAGAQVVLEERLSGDEFSVLAFCDGAVAVPMMIARDHKRALDGDGGLNTGGMGAYAPTTDLTPEEIQEITETVLQPTISAMAQRGTPYKGVLYAGLMRTPDGMRVLEFNCRFGDPETQVVLPMLESDLYDVMNACIDGELSKMPLAWHEGACATVVLASPGYPGTYPKGIVITLEPDALTSTVYHAGTTRNAAGELVTSGGRVMAVTSIAETLEAALDEVYQDIEAKHVHFDQMHYRTDIGRTTLG